jgi:hypothetical protein
MSICLNCGYAELCHKEIGCDVLDCPGFRDEPTDSEMNRGRVVDSFEGHGDFNSSDPWERYAAHRAAKGY